MFADYYCKGFGGAPCSVMPERGKMYCSYCLQARKYAVAMRKCIGYNGTCRSDCVPGYKVCQHCLLVIQAMKDYIDIISCNAQSHACVCLTRTCPECHERNGLLREASDYYAHMQAYL